ncbi:hypothetical protein TWF696_006750 [Orbilia brochopaga]|uniref:Uncharacterized protein n=1 Tax=Orbilia brochopaga TaxID=3140254 RepID=A0AAV9UT46_9PEZI
MFTTGLFSIISLALAAAANPVPATSSDSRPKGDAWADVTLCSYVVESGSTVTNYLGQIFQYTTWDGWTATIYSDLTQVSNTAVWTDSYIPHCVYSSPYCFVGTWQPTQANPHPEMFVWGPYTGVGKAVKIPITSPNTKVPANNNAGSELCLDKWPVQSLPGGPYKTYCVANDYNGKLGPLCTWGSATFSYYNQPYTL